MRPIRVIAFAAVVLIAAAGAFMVGRGGREKPPAPNQPATAIEPRTIDASRWSLSDPDLPLLAPPDPDAAGG